MGVNDSSFIDPPFESEKDRHRRELLERGTGQYHRAKYPNLNTKQRVQLTNKIL